MDPSAHRCGRVLRIQGLSFLREHGIPVEKGGDVDDIRTITLADLLERMRTFDVDAEAMRNPGWNRTPRKRALLERAAARARAAGIEPQVSLIDGRPV